MNPTQKISRPAKAKSNAGPVAGVAQMHVCGLNHVRAQVSLRERYALSPEEAEGLLQRIRASEIAEQALVLSTCNRTEIYAWDRRPGLGERLRDLFLELGGDDAESDGPPPLYQYQEHEAVRHLLAVSAGLDSMLLGENQIKQQIRQAYEMSQAAGCAGGDLHQAVQAAIAAGKRIRTETALNNGTLCVAKAAVLHGEARLEGLAGKTCLILGAGKIGKIAARAISERNPGRLLIVNRSLERAQELAGLVGAEAYELDALDGLLPQADFVIGAAYAPEQIVTAERYAWLRAISARPGHRLACFIDVAVPRIFDPALGELPGVELHNIEAMEEIVEANRRLRQTVAAEAWKIVEEEVEKFRAARLMAALGPRIKRLTEQFEEIFDQERATVEELAGGFSDRLLASQRRLKQRLLHQVIQELKAEATGQ